MFQVLAAHACYKVAAIVLRKNRVNPSIRDPKAFYPQFLDSLIQFVLKGDLRHCYQSVLIITDTPPTNRVGKAVLAGLSATGPKYIPPKVPFALLQHPSSAHACLQACDYCCWAIQRRWNGKPIPEYSTHVRPRMDRSELDVFYSGDQNYY